MWELSWKLVVEGRHTGETGTERGEILKAGLMCSWEIPACLRLTGTWARGEAKRRKEGQGGPVRKRGKAVRGPGEGNLPVTTRNTKDRGRKACHKMCVPTALEGKDEPY